jgi:F0F1-type ATP synthase assembly protein I
VKEKNRVKQLAVYGGVGLALTSEISGAALAGYFIGQFIESKFGGAPWWRVGCLLIFLAVAFWHLMLVLQKLSDKNEE